jgi:hypothetical protein
MERVHIDLSSLQEVRYDNDSAILEIDFRNGSTYQYFNVPRHAFDGLVSAESKGQYAAANIYKLFRQKKIR